MTLTPHDYQQEGINEILEKLITENKNSVLYQANTGAGKTVIMAFICQRWIEEKRGKIIITCHRKELVDQTVKTLTSIGISAQSYTASSKHKHAFVDVYVAMIETINNRLKKNKFDVDGISLVISDECHILVHHKIYEYFQSAKKIGFTATPVVMKKTVFFKCKYCKSEHAEETECCGFETEEWRKPFAMSNIYDDIVLGPKFEKLHEVGQLVPEISFIKHYADLSNLKVDSKTGDYTTQSLNEAYGTDNAAFNVLLNYKELCSGKRTIIFNSSTKTNLIVYEKFKEAGLNVKMYDSVNESDISRAQLVKWFNSTPDAILCNVGVFTTGFDSRDVEAIILNRSTKSLSLFLQIVGRGGRSSKNIYKDSFILIDGGENIAEFGEWSDNRDWEDIFWNGIGKPKAKKEDPIDLQDCPQCAALIPKSVNTCDICGYEIPTPEPKIKEEIESDDVLIPIREIPPPDPKKIYEYTKMKGENFHFALKVLYSRIVDMFIYYRVTKDKYESAKQSGELISKLRKFILPVYFYLIKQPDIQTGANRTLDYVIEKTKQKIEKYYYG